MSISEFHLLIADEKPVLVEFYADWCEPCKWLDSVLNEVDTNVTGRASIYKIDIDKFPELKQKFSIMSVPVLIIFKKNEVMWRMNGFTYAKELTAKLLEYV